MEAIITSMTAREREKPSIINPSRKRRIAAGSGTKVEDVNRVLRQYEQMQKMLKQFSNPGKMSKSCAAWAGCPVWAGCPALAAGSLLCKSGINRLTGQYTQSNLWR